MFVGTPVCGQRSLPLFVVHIVAPFLRIASRQLARFTELSICCACRIDHTLSDYDIYFWRQSILFLAIEHKNLVEIIHSVLIPSFAKKNLIFIPFKKNVKSFIKKAFVFYSDSLSLSLLSRVSVLCRLSRLVSLFFIERGGPKRRNIPPRTPSLICFPSFNFVVKQSTKVFEALSKRNLLSRMKYF
jgi:hypothetical protein